MRDAGLNEAIRTAGGVSQLAEKIGISQPSVSNWHKIPAERVLTVEKVTGIPRTTLRPDLYPEQARQIDEVDQARARLYGLLANLLTRAPSAELLAEIANLRGDATALGMAQIALADAAAATPVEKVEREYFELFIGIGRGELLPYGSYYLTGFLHERPLARLREDLARIGIERADRVAEPEDHAGILCEIMSALASGEIAAPGDSDKIIFEKHMASWIGRLFTDLERAQTADFYRHVGALGRVFMEIETEAFALAA
jgi:TorA maturation chaperone TorD